MHLCVLIKIREIKKEITEKNKNENSTLDENMMGHLY